MGAFEPEASDSCNSLPFPATDIAVLVVFVVVDPESSVVPLSP
jgi:hypothetical protein